jgi:DNA-binding NarL/FixJ family response regulator
VSEEEPRVLVVDDDDSCRSLMATLVRGVGLDVDEAASGEAALAIADRDTPLAVILDVSLPGISGYEVCRRLRERFGGDLPLMFVSGMRAESIDRVAGLLIGADDYLAKPFEPDELLARLRRLLAHTQTAPMRYHLTERELEVLGLLAEGLGQGEVAERLVISPRTVATHIQRILAKLGVRSRAQAVAVAYRERIISRGSSPLPG